jgi:tetratricopeptide (TPR) repeat protein
MRAAIERYKPFLERPSADPAPRAELARLYVNYGFTAIFNGTDYETVAIPAYEAAFAIQKQLLQEHPENRTLRSNLGWTYVFFGWGGPNVSNNREALAQAASIFEALVKETPDDPLARADLAWALWETTFNADPASAQADSTRAMAIREQLVKEFPQSAEFRRDLADSLHRHAFFVRDDPIAALALLSRATEIRTTLVADMEHRAPAIRLPLRPRDSEFIVRPSLIWTKRDVAYGCTEEAYFRGQIKQWPEALALSDRAIDIYRPLVDQNPSINRFIKEFGAAAGYDAAAAEVAGDADAAQTRRRETINFLRARLPADDSELADALAEFTSSLLGSGKFSEAEPTAREYLTIYEKRLPDDWRTFDARSMLGGCLLGQKKYAEAEPLLLSGYEGVRQREDKIDLRYVLPRFWRFPANSKPWLKEPLRRVVQLYEATGRPDQAAQWKKKLETTGPPSSK